MPREVYQITVDRPDAVTITDFKAFLRQAVSNAGLFLDDEHPLFGEREARIVRVS